MSTNNNLERSQRTPDAFTKTVASRSTAASLPLALKWIAHVSEAPELDGIGNQADRHGTYYAQLALFTCFVVGYIVAWTLPYGLDYTGNIFAALAKVVLMALVAYPSWSWFSEAPTDMGRIGTAMGLLYDCLSCWIAMAWKSYSRAREIVYLPYRLIAALFQRQGASQGEDYA